VLYRDSPLRTNIYGTASYLQLGKVFETLSYHFIEPLASLFYRNADQFVIYKKRCEYFHSRQCVGGSLTFRFVEQHCRQYAAVADQRRSLGIDTLGFGDD